MRKLLLAFCAVSALLRANAQQKISPDSIKQKMQWFADAKLGIFIHAGIYSVKGVDESWSFHNKKIGYTDYMSQLKGFNNKNYDPSAMAALIEQSGARYAVFTTKHHDGVAMYNTKLNNLSIVKATPAQKDMTGPLFSELRKRNIKCGAYYSLIDWSYPDYPGFLKDSSCYKVSDDYERWNKFRRFFQGQIDEINTLYKPDLWWFDGDWEHSAEEWESEKVRHIILKRNPHAIINGRLQGYGDYETPEQNFPVTKPQFNWWELCMTTNNNWGYQPTDNNWKTPYEIITIFADAISNGGNLLLDIAPKADGTIPSEQVNILQELGKWNKKHGEAVFETIAGLPQGHFYGPTTMSKDSSTIYLFLPAGAKKQVMLKGIQNKINSIQVVGTNTPLSHKVVGKISWSPVPGLIYIEVPENVQDEYVTVLRLKLDGPVKLYRGKGGLTE